MPPNRTHLRTVDADFGGIGGLASALLERRAWLTALFPLVMACSNTAENSERSVARTNFPCVKQTPQRLVSAPWPSPDREVDTGCPWEAFNGGETLYIEHAAGAAPDTVLIYLAFGEDGRGAALAAGDLAQVVGADATQIAIRNATESDFYLRFVLEFPLP